MTSLEQYQSELKDLRLELRLVCAVLAFYLAKDMVAGGMWVLSAQSITGRIAQLSTYPTLLAACWILLAVPVAPYLLVQLLDIFPHHATTIKRVALRAIMANGAIWGFLGYLSKNLDYQFVTEIFVINALVCFAMSAVMAYGINSAQRRAREGAK